MNSTSIAFPLTTAQMGLWLTQQLQPHAHLNIAEALEIECAVDSELFLEAFRQTVRETGALRVRFANSSDGPSQLIGETYNGLVTVLDFSDRDGGRDAAWDWVRERASAVTVLRDPLCVAALLKAAPNYFIFYHSVPHILADGYSGMLFAERLSEIYTALVEGRELSQDNALVPYESVIEAEVSYRQSNRFERDKQYWMERLEGVPKLTTSLPFQLEQPLTPGVGGRLRQHVFLEPHTCAALRFFAKAEGVTLPQLFVGLVAMFLHRMTNQDDFVVGFPVTGRVS
ncbi:MAG TPA: condensation domain-containing protein, partial [Acidobacteriaceae bacterium]